MYIIEMVLVHLKSLYNKCISINSKIIVQLKIKN